MLSKKSSVYTVLVNCRIKIINPADDSNAMNDMLLFCRVIIKETNRN